MKEKLLIVKIGGHVIDGEGALEALLDQLADAAGHKILVHGGGKLATDLARRLGMPQRLIDGRRVTDGETLKVVTMVYAGIVNKTIVSGLQARGCNAIGLCGADANLIKARKRAGLYDEYGFVGDIDRVDADRAAKILQEGHVLVMAPITHDGKGQLLNTNADTIAQELAVALCPLFDVQLVYCFEKRGVLQDSDDEHSVISKIGKESLPSLVEQKIIHGGMLPKIENAIAASERGVRSVTIGHWSQLSGLIARKSGTTIGHGHTDGTII